MWLIEEREGERRSRGGRVLTCEGGEVEKEVVHTSWESWTPAKAPPSSSSGGLDTHTQRKKRGERWSSLVPPRRHPLLVELL